MFAQGKSPGVRNPTEMSENDIVYSIYIFQVARNVLPVGWPVTVTSVLMAGRKQFWTKYGRRLLLGEYSAVENSLGTPIAVTVKV